MTAEREDELKQLRRELTATRVAALGLLVVVLLSLYGASRTVVYSALVVVLLVMTFLGCRWGLGDTEMNLPQSIGVTAGLGALFLLLMLWAAI